MPPRSAWTLNGEEFGAPFEGFIALEEGSMLLKAPILTVTDGTVR